MVRYRMAIIGDLLDDLRIPMRVLSDHEKRCMSLISFEHAQQPWCKHRIGSVIKC
jgi:hypothetical protein